MTKDNDRDLLARSQGDMVFLNGFVIILLFVGMLESCWLKT